MLTCIMTVRDDRKLPWHLSSFFHWFYRSAHRTVLILPTLSSLVICGLTHTVRGTVASVCGSLASSCPFNSVYCCIIKGGGSRYISSP